MSKKENIKNSRIYLLKVLSLVTKLSTHRVGVLSHLVRYSHKCLNVEVVQWDLGSTQLIILLSIKNRFKKKVKTQRKHLSKKRKLLSLKKRKQRIFRTQLLRKKLLINKNKVMRIKLLIHLFSLLQPRRSNPPLKRQPRTLLNQLSKQ